MKRNRRWLMVTMAATVAAMVFGSGPAVTAGEGSSPEVVRAEPATVEVVIEKDGTRELYFGAASCQGQGLPGRESITALVDVGETGRIFAARIVKLDQHWSVPEWPSTLADLPELTQYALWETKTGYGAMINATGGGMITYLSGADGGVKVTAMSYMDGFAPDTSVPLFALGFGVDPYQLTRDLYEFGLAAMKRTDPRGVIGKLRSEKEYPRILEYVGWCSWNAHYTDVSASDLLAHGAIWKEAGFPMRWVIIDDGWETLQETVSKSRKKRGMSLSSFEAHPEKFPGGLAPVVKALKDDYGVTWVGAWNTFNGYWNGVALDSELGRNYNDALLPISEGFGIPDVRDRSGRAFWDGYYGFLVDQGIDFVKTDNQSTMYDFTEGLLPVGLAYANGQRNFQASAGEHFDSAVINCMSMNVDSIYQWEKTNVARASRDYYPLQWHNPRIHTRDCVMNSMWFSNLVYPDYDMWQTHNHYRMYHAVARAISGGPLYVTDKPGKERFEHLWPLVLADGKVLRVDRPGLPARKSLFSNPLTSGRPLYAFARSGGSGLLAVWNLDRFERPMRAEVSPRDVDGLQGSEFAVYEHFSGELVRMERAEVLNTWLKGWDVRLYSIVPISQGFAPIGLVNKLASPVTVKEWSAGPGEARVRLAEPGRFVAYAERGPVGVLVNGAPMDSPAVKRRGNALVLDLGPGAHPPGEVEVEITW